MSMVTLAPRTKRGKQLLKDHGPRWELLWESDYSISVGGPGWFVQSIVDENEKRWISPKGLPHFYVRKKQGSK